MNKIKTVFYDEFYLQYNNSYTFVFVYFTNKSAETFHPFFLAIRCLQPKTILCSLLLNSRILCNRQNEDALHQFGFVWYSFYNESFKNDRVQRSEISIEQFQFIFGWYVGWVHVFTAWSKHLERSRSRRRRSCWLRWAFKYFYRFEFRLDLLCTPLPLSRIWLNADVGSFYSVFGKTHW